MKRDIYEIGNEVELLYKGRPSIIILYKPGHYELVGLKNGSIVETHFEKNHPLIKLLRKRVKSLLKKKIKNP